ncbi:MAG: hypothetical protein ACI914_000551, partial [Candidatus Marivariicella framensis]
SETVSNFFFIIRIRENCNIYSNLQKNKNQIKKLI